MPDATTTPSAATAIAGHERVTPLQLATLVMSVGVLVLLLMETVVDLSPPARQVLQWFDSVVCVFFFADFVSRFRRAPDKARFMRWGWIDLLASIPVVDAFRVGRLVQMVRVIRLLRALRSAATLMRYFLKHDRLSSLGSLGSVFVVLLLAAAVGVLHFENDGASNIRTPWDAVWWAFTTITTVGYGDRFPVTGEGRVIACLLMICGVGLFSVLSGLIASILVHPEISRGESEVAQLSKEIRLLREKLDRLQPPPEPEPAGQLTADADRGNAGHP